MDYVNYTPGLDAETACALAVNNWNSVLEDISAVLCNFLYRRCYRHQRRCLCC